MRSEPPRYPLRPHQQAIRHLEDSCAQGKTAITLASDNHRPKPIRSGLQRIAEQVPELNIIAATGVYTQDDVPFYFYERGPALNGLLGTDVPDPMADMFVSDITGGITGTGVQAGMLKCAVDEKGMAPGVERVMRGHRSPPPHRRAGHRAHPQVADLRHRYAGLGDYSAWWFMQSVGLPVPASSVPASSA